MRLKFIVVSVMERMLAVEGEMDSSVDQNMRFSDSIKDGMAFLGMNFE